MRASLISPPKLDLCASTKLDAIAGRGLQLKNGRQKERNVGLIEMLNGYALGVTIKRTAIGMLRGGEGLYS